MRSAVRSVPASYREAALRCYMGGGGDTKQKTALAPSSPALGGEVTLSGGVRFFQLLTLIGTVRKMFWCQEKLIRVFLTEQITKDNGAGITGDKRVAHCDYAHFWDFLWLGALRFLFNHTLFD